jgi:hypothetical protein
VLRSLRSDQWADERHEMREVAEMVPDLRASAVALAELLRTFVEPIEEGVDA